MNDRSKPTILYSSDPGTDEVLVSAAKDGNQRAFEVLVERHQQRMLAFARRYTRVREDAEDVVQQTFQKAFIHLNKFQGKSSFSTWLTRIAINEALMLMRRGRALREIPLDDSSDHGRDRRQARRRLQHAGRAPGPGTRSSRYRPAHAETSARRAVGLVYGRQGDPRAD